MFAEEEERPGLDRNATECSGSGARGRVAGVYPAMEYAGCRQEAEEGVVIEGRGQGRSRNAQAVMIASGARALFE